MNAETPAQAFGGLLAMNTTFFFLGLAGTLWAHKLKDPRLELAPKTGTLKTAVALIFGVRVLSAVVLVISLFLFYKLWRFSGTMG